MSYSTILWNSKSFTSKLNIKNIDDLAGNRPSNCFRRYAYLPLPKRDSTFDGLLPVQSIRQFVRQSINIASWNAQKWLKMLSFKYCMRLSTDNEKNICLYFFIVLFRSPLWKVFYILTMGIIIWISQEQFDGNSTGTT